MIRRQFLVVLGGLAAPAFSQDAPLTLADKKGVEHYLASFLMSGEPVALPLKPLITMMVQDRGRVAGSSAVNRYFGRVEVSEDGKVEWVPPGLAATLRAGPPELMELEGRFFQGLVLTERVRLTERAMRFETEDGATALEFVRLGDGQAVERMFGVNQRLVKLMVDGEKVALPDGAIPTLTLDKENKVFGFGGVNRYSGTYMTTSADGGIEFSEGGMVSTRMAGPPEWMLMESRYFQALQSATGLRATALGVIFENVEKATRLEFELAAER